MVKKKLNDELKSKLTEIVKEVNKYDKMPEHLIDPVFELHNSLFNIKEVNKGCGACRKRTFGRLQTLYNEEVLNS
jgi:hypothetical protein